MFNKLLILMYVLQAMVFAESLEDAVHFSQKFKADSYRNSETAVLEFDINIEKKFHIYSTDPNLALNPTSTEFYDTTYFEIIGILEEPDPVIKYDANFDQNLGIHKNSFTLSQKLKLASNLKPGEYEITGSFNYLACDPVKCIPKWDDFSVLLVIEDGPARLDYIANVTPWYSQYDNLEDVTDASEDGTESMVDEAISEGLGSFVLLSISMGFLALLTPCVFPMIPITVSFFTKMGETSGQSPIKSATIYTLGIITIFTSLGLALAFTFGATGANQIASSPWINLFIAGLFIYFAMSLFGYYEIELPSVLRQFSMKQEQRGGNIGILFMAMTFTLTSFTCTVQFVGLLLVAASQGEYFWPGLGMILFSTAFALPFFFLALFPQYLAKLPKSGGWLNAVKVTMGFLELGAAMKFISNTDLVWQWGLFTRPVVLASWVVISFLMGIYLLGKIQLPHDTKLDIVGVPRLMLSTLFLSFSLYISTGLFGQPIHGLIDSYLPPDFAYTSIEKSNGSKNVSGHADLVWYENFTEGMQVSQETEKPVFIDFTGYTCTNCRWMETNVFEEQPVLELFENFVLVRLFTDGGPMAREYQKMEVERFGTAALPFYVILSPNNEELARFPGMDPDVSKFVAFLEKGLSV